MNDLSTNGGERGEVRRLVDMAGGVVRVAQQDHPRAGRGGLDGGGFDQGSRNPGASMRGIDRQGQHLGLISDGAGEDEGEDRSGIGLADDQAKPARALQQRRDFSRAPCFVEARRMYCGHAGRVFGLGHVQRHGSARRASGARR